ncbi:hypothetical protein ABIE30_002944 [Janthinobacterium lividum]
MTMLDVKIRWEQQHDAMPELRLYALVDGAQYQTQHNKRLLAGTGLFPLFKGTPDAGLSHAGPWLVDVASVAESFVEELTALERDTPSLSWLISPQDLMDSRNCCN